MDKLTLEGVTVENMQSPRGNTVPNQFIIKTANGVFFQSYSTLIAFESKAGEVFLSEDWNYSRTTMKYLKQFLGDNKKEVEAKIKEGSYKIVKFW